MHANELRAQESDAPHLSDFGLMAEAIRSGQVPNADVIAILSENPAFSAWYRERYRPDNLPS